MKKRDLLLAGLILFNVSAFAQEDEPLTPPRYSDDAKQIFIQDFEGSKDWQTIRLNPDPKRPTTLYTWQAQPVDKIEQVTYYKRTKSDNPSGGTNIYNGDAEWEIAGVRDTLIDMYDGVMRTDAAWPDDSTLQWDSHAIMDHTDATQHGEGGNKEYGLDRYGEDGGSQYFRYTSATSKGTANRGGGKQSGWSTTHDETATDQDHYVPEYRRNLFVRNLPIENNSSYRVTVFVKPTMQTKLQKGVKARIGLDLMRGYFHSEKPFLVDSYGVKGSDNKISYKSFADKTDYTNLEVGKWNKITLMSYYNNDSVGRASAYLLSYYWNNDWDWNVKVDADGKVAAEGDSAVLKFVQQPDKFFVRLAFRSDSTQFDVDNLSLTKSWIAGVEYSGEMLRVDFGYKTNLGELAQAAKDLNKIAAVQLPGNYFDVWALWDVDGTKEWEQVPILSAEYQGDGYMYMWTEPYEDTGDARSFDGADSVLVSFFNSVASDDLKLKYTGDQYPNGMDTVWVKSGKPVFDFHNEIATLNPTIGISPVTKQPVKSLAELCPVLQKEPYEDGTFGLDPTTRTLRFKFSKNLSFDNAGKLSAKTKVILRGGGKEEYWNIKDYPADSISGWTTIERPAEFDQPLAGDYVLSFEQVTHLKNPDLNNSEDYGDPVKFNYHFGDFSVNPEVITYFETNWNVPANATEAVCLGTAIIDGTSTSYTLGTGAKGKGSRLYRYSDAGQMDCAYYLCPRGTSVDAHLFIGVGDEEYHINLNKGTYNLSFYALGWDGKSATNLYFYPAPTEDKKPSEVATDDKTLVGTFTPTNHIPNGDGKKTNYVISTADAMNYVINIPADGTYIIEFEMPKAANWNGTLYSDIHITNVGALSDGPVNKINTAIASAAKMLASADAAKYRGADYDKLTDVKATADGFIALQKATKVNKPSVYEAEGKEVDAAVSALKLHMDTVDAFDKAFADVEAKLAVYADSLKAFEGLAVVDDLKAIKTTMSDYAYSEKAPGVIAADTKTMNDGIKAVDDRQAINDQFTTAITDAEKSLADPKASKFAAESANLDEAIKAAKQFDAVAATDDELKGQMASLNEIKLALDVKLLAADVVSIRIKALDKLAKSVGASYGDATAEIQGRIDNIDSDDDGLANVMKAAIKAALYSKIANGDSIGVVDLTPFIKNYHLYATITGPVVDNSSKELPNSRNDAECKGENNPGSQIMKIGHQWGQDALGKKIWVLLYGTDYDNVFPGWTVKSFITGRGHSMVTPDNKDYTNLSKGIPVFDGALTLDWNSQAQLSTSLDDLPVGVYNLSVPFGSLDAATDAATTFKATTTADEYVAKFEADGAKSATLDSIKVNDGKMDIFLELQSKDGSSSADNFALKFLAKDESFNYALAAQSAVNEMNALITVVGDVEAADAKIEYFTLGGIQVTVLEKGQAYIQKITIGDEIITKTVFVE
jgi:hypothetical protein